MAEAGCAKARSVGGVVVVHGGAWDIPQHLWKASVEGVKAAARRGYQVSFFVCHELRYCTVTFYIHSDIYNFKVLNC